MANSGKQGPQREFTGAGGLGQAVVAGRPVWSGLMQRLKRPLNRSGAANILETGDDERENFTQVGCYQVTHYAARTTSSYSLSKNKPFT